MMILLTLTLPFLLALGGLHPRLRSIVVSNASWAAVPALLLALWNPPHSTVEVSWLFIGIRLGLDDVGRSFVIVTALLWTLAGVSARASFVSGSKPPRLFIAYLVTLTGTLGLFMAQDLPTFTLFYALMTFAAYGLIVDGDNPVAQRAARMYLILAVVGEAVLLEAVLLITTVAGNQGISQIPEAVAAAPERNLIIGLLLTGFGIRIGVVPLHVWIPLVYSSAPTAFSAVLSGSMLMAGFLGWMRLLPLGGMFLPEWGIVWVVAGSVALLYGVGVGLTQNNPGTILAYSTISQAGMITTGFGMGMVMPDLWPRIDHLLVLHALHSALVMGALFLGLSVARKSIGTVWQQRSVVFGLMVPALALAGAPFSSGTPLKNIFDVTAPMTPWTAPLIWVPVLGAIGTTLLMGRFLIEAAPQIQGEGTQLGDRLPTGVWLPWAILLLCGGILTGVVRFKLFVEAESLLLPPTAIWASLWPILLGVILVWGVMRKPFRFSAPSIPPGDLLVGIEWVAHRAREPWHNITKVVGQTWRSNLTAHPLLHKSGSWVFSIIATAEDRLGQWKVLGAAFLFLAALFLTLLIISSGYAHYDSVSCTINTGPPLRKGAC